jgi:hypothetical protein
MRFRSVYPLGNCGSPARRMAICSELPNCCDRGRRTRHQASAACVVHFWQLARFWYPAGIVDFRRRPSGHHVPILPMLVLNDGWTPDLLAAPAVIPLCGYQFPVPAQNRLWSHDSGHLLDHLPPEYLAFHSQEPPLVIVEQDAFLAEFFSEHAFSARRYSITSCS